MKEQRIFTPETANIDVKMLGTLTISCGDLEISSLDNRSKKVWLLFAYLVYNRNRYISREELFKLLMPGEDDSTDPQNALKALVHRLRLSLNKLWKGAGHELIIWKENRYTWNNNISVRVDIDLLEETFSRHKDKFLNSPFDADCGHEFREKNLDEILDAIILYSGDFLSNYSYDSWVMPISTYYHNMYIALVTYAIDALEKLDRKKDVIDLCHKVLEVDPYNEDFYRHLMSNLIDIGNNHLAVDTYEKLRKLLFSDFGVLPSDEIQSLYAQALSFVGDTEITPEILSQKMLQNDNPVGAMVCDYNSFRMIYQANARLIARSGDAFHVALLSLKPKQNKKISRKSLDRALENLLYQAKNNLRRGDIVSKGSVSQILIMLPQANYENSCKVCERIAKAYNRQHPHSPALVNYSVQPITPIK